MSKHTPGPWNIGAPPPNGEQTIGTQQGLMVAVATTGAGVPTEVNANLIAAAPELLEALEALTLIMNLNDDDVWTDESWQVALNKARAAIAKATGGQQ